MPYVTEELWAVKGAEGPKRETILALADWPQFEGLVDAAAEAEIGRLVDLVSEIRSARSETNVPAGAQIPLVLVTTDAETKAWTTRWSDTLKRLARLSDISFAAGPPAQSIQMVVRGEVAALPLEGVIDIPAEHARLAKEIEKLDGEMRKIEAKLGNADFMARAPEEVVEEQRDRLEESAARREKLQEALTRLGGGR